MSCRHANPREDDTMSKTEEKSLREQQVEARKKRMAELNPPVERVRVTPANDDLRRVLKHPKGGLAFPAGSGSVEWPLDQFTRRRIKDGSVIREEPAEKEASKTDGEAGSGRRRTPASPPETAA
jgi:hypothetical protein